jgi:hypothetical protein
MRGAGEGLVILIIGTMAIWGASLVPPPPEGETWAGVLPMGASVCLALSGALMALTGLKAGADKTEDTVFSPRLDRTSVKVLSLVILAVLYHQAILKFGYELPTAVIGPAVLWMFGVRSKAGLALSIILYPLVFHLLFFKLLRVFPPIGDIFDLMDSLRG